MDSSKLGGSSSGPVSSDPKNRVSRHRLPRLHGVLKPKHNIKLINFLICFSLLPLILLFSFSKDLSVLYGCEVFEAGFSQFAGFFKCFSDFDVVFIALKGYQLRVEQCVLNLLVP